jgi:hypothetical protein
MPKIVTIGLDIAKNVFQLHGVDRSSCARRCVAARSQASSAPFRRA